MKDQDQESLFERIDPEDPLNESFMILAKILAIMRMSAYVFCVYSILQGTLIILGGPARFSSAAYRTALLLPYAPQSWGWCLAIFGVISFIGVKNRKYLWGAIGMFGAGVWSMAFALAFLISSIQYPEANLTAAAAYGKDSILFILIGMTEWLLSKSSISNGDP